MWLLEKLIPRYGSRGDVTSVDDNVDFFSSEVDNQELMRFVGKVKEVTKERKLKYEEYQKMSDDAVIGSALELMADDASQPDPDTGMCYWFSCSDKSIEDTLNSWLRETIKINTSAWTYAYNLAKYGELFLKTYDSSPDADTDDLIVGDYFELVQDPSTVSDILLYGKTITYQVGDKNTTLHDTKEYIHILCDKGNNRDKIKVKLERKNKISGEYEEIEKDTYVRYGSSFIEEARQAWAIMDMIETILLTSRFSRSMLYRLVQIEVGSSDRVETRRIINEVKRSINSKEYLKKDQQYRSDRFSMPVATNVYTPTRNNKGDIRIDTVGGDVDVKEIVDVEYFRNKLFAALKVPKVFLGYDEMMPGGIGNMSLTKLDVRYGRTIKRIKSCLSDGILEMGKFKLSKLGKLKDGLKIEVKTSKVTTSEEADRRDETLADITLAQTLVELISTNFEEFVDKKELMNYVLDKVLELTDSKSFTGGDNNAKGNEGEA